jgi:hypothetical protein
MRRAIGIALLLVSLIAGIVLLVSGNLYSSQVIDVASGGTSTSRWEVTAVDSRSIGCRPLCWFWLPSQASSWPRTNCLQLAVIESTGIAKLQILDLHFAIS